MFYYTRSRSFTHSSCLSSSCCELRGDFLHARSKQEGIRLTFLLTLISFSSLFLHLALSREREKKEREKKVANETHDLLRSRKEEESRKNARKNQVRLKQMRHWTVCVAERKEFGHCTWLFSCELKTHCKFLTAQAYPLFIMRPVTS